MSLSIPAAITDYFNAANDQDADGAARCFSPDGVVRDDGEIHQGTQEIRAWTEAASKKYSAVIAPVAVRSEGETSVVNCRVSGNFPGSPVELKFAFVLADDGIAALEVTV